MNSLYRVTTAARYNYVDLGESCSYTVYAKINICKLFVIMNELKLG